MRLTVFFYLSMELFFPHFPEVAAEIAEGILDSTSCTSTGQVKHSVIISTTMICATSYCITLDNFIHTGETKRFNYHKSNKDTARETDF